MYFQFNEITKEFATDKRSWTENIYDEACLSKQLTIKS